MFLLCILYADFEVKLVLRLKFETVIQSNFDIVSPKSKFQKIVSPLILVLFFSGGPWGYNA